MTENAVVSPFPAGLAVDHLRWRLPSRLSPAFLFGVLYLAIQLILRIVLWRAFAPEVGSFRMLAILGSGVLNDVLQLVYLLLPMTLYCFLLPERWWRSRSQKVLVALLMFFFVFGLLYLCVTEYYFFEEFESRFNLVAVDYLIYPNEVLVNIRDSYPVGRVLALTLGGALGITAMLWKRIRAGIAGIPILRRQRLAWMGVHVLAAAVLATVPNTITMGANNRLDAQLAANGITSFFSAFRTNELSYRDYYATRNRPETFAHMRRRLSDSGGTLASIAPEDLRRIHAANPQALGKLNVIVVVEESFGCQYVHICGGERHLTPNFDALTKEGLFFTHAYSTGTRTVRGLEAITASFPPIPSESIIKRPGSENIDNWGAAMRTNGYRTSFLYGGLATFDNMRHFYSSNGFEVVDRGDIATQTFSTIWGVCDKDLFNHALGYFDGEAKKGPFFSMIMSTSNHKPFTFPTGVPGVVAIGGGRDAGVRYADWALGKFIKDAASHPWFRNTMFVIVADHGVRVYGNAEIPMRTYEIPVLFYAPGRIAPRNSDQLISQIDIAPTVLAMLGLPYRATFYGRDVFGAQSSSNGVLLNHNHDVAYYRDGKLVVLGLNDEVKTYLYDRATDRQIPTRDNPELTSEAISYYQTAYDLFSEHRYR